MQQYLPVLLNDLNDAQSMELRHAETLASTDRYWPLAISRDQSMEPVTVNALTYRRAAALAGMGRTSEASQLLERVLGQIKQDPHGEPGLQRVTYVLRAKLAFQPYETASARAWIPCRWQTRDWTRETMRVIGLMPA